MAPPSSLGPARSRSIRLVHSYRFLPLLLLLLLLLCCSVSVCVLPPHRHVIEWGFENGLSGRNTPRSSDHPRGLTAAAAGRSSAGGGPLGENGPRGMTLRARGSGSAQGRTGPGALRRRGPLHICGTSLRPLPDRTPSLSDTVKSPQVICLTRQPRTQMVPALRFRTLNLGFGQVAKTPQLPLQPQQLTHPGVRRTTCAPRCPACARAPTWRSAAASGLCVDARSCPSRAPETRAGKRPISGTTDTGRAGDGIPATGIRDTGIPGTGSIGTGRQDAPGGPDTAGPDTAGTVRRGAGAGRARTRSGDRGLGRGRRGHRGAGTPADGVSAWRRTHGRQRRPPAPRPRRRCPRGPRPPTRSR